MDFFDKSYYSLTKRIMSCIGQWPLQAPYQRCIIRTFLALFMSSIAIPEVIKLVNVINDLETVFECIPPLGLHLINIMKCTTCSFSMEKMKVLLIHMEYDWKRRCKSNNEDPQIIDIYAQRGGFLALIYAYYMFVGGFAYVSIPLIPVALDFINPLNVSRPREHLFHAEYFVDQEKFFVPIYIHALVTTMTSMAIVAGCDTMYGAYIHYICGKFAELSDELENTITSENADLRVSENIDRTYHHMVKCVKKHVEVIEICNFMESTYTLYFFFAFGLNIFLMSFTGIQTVLKLSDPKLALRYGCFTIGQAIHAFFSCWHGQIVMDHSRDVNIAVYQSNWYEFSFRSRIVATGVMMRSEEPCQLTAGKLFPVSLETFTTLMKTTMSYFTLLRSFE